MNIDLLTFSVQSQAGDDTSLIQGAIDECHASGGGRVTVPSGKTYVCGPFQLKANVELHLQGDALIQASTDESLYKESAFKDNYSEGSLWISAWDAENVSITGTGTLDGRGTEFMLDEEPTHFNYKIENDIDMRPHLLTLYGCSNVVIRDITFRNAAYWCLHPVGCRDVLIQGIRILNSLKVRNCDGIDPDHSRNVRISDCYIESADDCICLKTRREFDEYGPTENVTVTGCTLVSTSCAIKLGSENTQGIRNAVFSSIVITRTNRAIGIQNRDEGPIENITFSNIIADCRLFHDVWWGKSEPIYITSVNRHETEHLRFPPDGVRRPAGPVRDILFNHIQCRSENGIYVCGCDESRPSRLQFDHVMIDIDKKTEYPGGLHDRRPCDIEGIIESGTSGFHFDNCDDILLTNCRVFWGDHTPDYFKHALLAEDTTELVTVNFQGKAAVEGLDDLVIRSRRDG